jgi:tRNA-dihydrouridine synthase 4
MVRYSKLEFRSLTKMYDADLCFTPMTIANSFARSEISRQNEFTTNEGDTPLITQFAANNVTDFLYATKMVEKYCDGVDLNCGCPQQWAKQDGYGCYLLQKTEVIEDMLKTVRRNTSNEFSISIKIRLLPKGDEKIKQTVELCRILQNLNVTFITIHGRTPYEKSTSVAVDEHAIAEIKKSIDIPLVFNGDVMSLSHADRFYEATKCDGFMSARGILSNPALFAGYEKTPLSCVQDWIDIHNRQREKMTFQNFHHHLVFMMESNSGLLSKQDRKQFNDLTKREQCLQFLDDKLSIRPREIQYSQNIICQYDDSDYKKLITSKEFWSNNYSSESTHGKYFLSKLYKMNNEPDDYLEFMDDSSSLFN